MLKVKNILNWKSYLKGLTSTIQNYVKTKEIGGLLQYFSGAAPLLYAEQHNPGMSELTLDYVLCSLSRVSSEMMNPQVSSHHIVTEYQVFGNILNQQVEGITAVPDR